MHPTPQELECPGCGKTFVRLGGLMRHAEHDKCPGINTCKISEEREKKVIFIRELGLGLQPGGQQLGPGKGDPDFSKYMGYEGQSRTETRPQVASESPVNGWVAPEKLQKNNENFPPLGEAKGRPSSSKDPKSVKGNNGTEKPNQKGRDSWDQPTSAQKVDWDPHDPANPNFEPSMYWNAQAEKYKCPKLHCR